MKSSAFIPEDNLLLKNAIEDGDSQESLAKGNKKIPNKRKEEIISRQYYRTRRRVKSRSSYSPDLSYIDRCSNFSDDVTFNHKVQVGDVIFSDCLAKNLGSIATTYSVDKSPDGCQGSVQNDYINGKLTENVCFLLQDNLMDFFNPDVEMKDVTHMHRGGDSDNSSAVTEVEYASLPDYIICSLNTEDTIDDIPDSQLMDSPKSVLEDSSFDGDEQYDCNHEDDVESSSVSQVDSVPLSEVEIICMLNTEDLEIPCNDNIIFSPIHSSPSVRPETATDSVDPSSSFSESQMDGPDLSSELDSTHQHVDNTPEDDSMDNNPSISDPNNSDGDNDLPCFPDIEALILKLDFEYAQESWITNEVKRCKYVPCNRMVNSQEHSSSQRAMSSLGAFAVFYSHHFNYYIKKTEVTIGRSTDDTEVDIDLRKESHASLISRKQATIKMETDGTFALKNIGKGSILVKGTTVDHGEVCALDSSCLIQIRGMDFMFEINDSYVRWYLDNIIKKTQGKFRTFEWSVTGP